MRSSFYSIDETFIYAKNHLRTFRFFIAGLHKTQTLGILLVAKECINQKCGRIEMYIFAISY